MTRLTVIAGLVLALSSTAGARKKPKTDTSALDEYIRDAKARGVQNRGASPGSLWQSNARFASLGADPRAAYVDDLVTIVVAESASAVASGTVKTQRNSAASASASAGKTSSPVGAVANMATLTGAQSLDGQGTTSRETSLTTTLTARVTDVLPNGYLVVEGKKLVGVNSEQQVVTIRGVVRPIDLAADNSIPSDRLAQMEVSVNGKGVVGEAVRRPMFLYRLLLGLLPF
jgi:flagellar L-ring protein precursor FlgH